jgi:hypothetical protein
VACPTASPTSTAPSPPTASARSPPNLAQKAPDSGAFWPKFGWFSPPAGTRTGGRRARPGWRRACRR